MKIAINQPYYLPYLGYFQLLAAADLFVAYENVAYTRKSWISRNRLQGKAKAPYYISLPTVKVPNGTLIRDVLLHDSAPSEVDKLLLRIRMDYAKATHFEQVFQELVLMFQTASYTSLYSFNNHCLAWICKLCGLPTKLVLNNESLLKFEGQLAAEYEQGIGGGKLKRVFGLMEHFGADHYLNLSGGIKLYGREDFSARGLQLDFVQTPTVQYDQFGDSFTPHLSILDTLFHCGVDRTRAMIYEYRFVKNQKL